MKNNNGTMPYSYHTFIFPFLFQGGSKRITRKKFAECLRNGVYEDKFIAANKPSKEEHGRYRYFNQAARNAIYMTEYVEMIILVIAQRASLLAFERAISEISCKKTKLNIKKVHKEYIVFQSELLLQEVTAQQQGIELYKMMLENLFVTEQQNGIENQIDSLYELNTARYESRENLILSAISILGIFEVVSTIIAGLEADTKWWFLGAGVPLAAIVIILYSCKLPTNRK